MENFIQLELFDRDRYYSKKAHLELFESLEAYLPQAIKGLTFQTEASYPYDVFSWKASQHGEFSVENLLLSTGDLTLIDLDNILKDFNHQIANLDLYSGILFNRKRNITDSKINEDFIKTSTEKIINIKKIIQEKTSHLQIYLLKAGYLDSDYFYIVICETKEKDWIGFFIRCTRHERFLQKEVPRFSQIEAETAIKNNTIEIITTLEKIAASLFFLPKAPYYSDFELKKSLYPDYSDYDLKDILHICKSFVCKISSQRKYLLEQILESIEFMRIETLNVDSIKELDEISSVSAVNQDFKTLLELLKTYLTNLRLYWLGLVNIDVYMIGDVLDGDKLGDRSIAVFTEYSQPININ
ncbi:MAG: nuclease A inhibitor family protein [Hydrococcus sp. Prado102]|jgi:hypothetical protein|nr:nuclease A inhibitor family protein [Hydrococcus sp. Prado102]